MRKILISQTLRGENFNIFHIKYYAQYINITFTERNRAIKLSEIHYQKSKYCTKFPSSSQNTGRYLEFPGFSRQKNRL